MESAELLGGGQNRGQPNFDYGFGAETASKTTFGPVLVSAIVVSVKFLLQP